MSYFSRLSRPNGSNTFDLGQRGYEPVQNGQTLSPGDPRRKSLRAKRCRPATIGPLVVVIIILAVIYFKSKDKLDHYGTAVRCRLAVSNGNFPNAPTLPHGNNTNEANWAKIVTPSELIRKLERGERMNTKILHQSWKDSHLPERFKAWSEQWRILHGNDWVYVLWTDADNLQLVQKYYPNFLQTYKDLPKEIYRADMARNMYMHRFGGVYADLDLIPLQALSKHLPVLVSSAPPPIRLAYVGHMSGDEFEHSIPNAFMAATPTGHPFWLKPLEFIRDHMGEHKYNKQPEELTGPVALRRCVKNWEAERDARHGQGVFDEVVVLENGKIYPFSWWDAPFTDQCVCRPQSASFNPLHCNSLYPHAWTITYWSHSWEAYSW
ncbi:glycosyltransferase family 32 protein [Serendipita vermifera MAFF 305830]|uniref:Glycosyltransferase family 32 protein n=1 Tax=Serendipita vermifera MAFF 305830 TaxID=933852 RepID=A0A0C3BQH0_SERVB|nr:glycosyltransferase family 32 protein [Serendipita vermifera MAFF 305830]